jgi:CelD/BcsL family acetyltransferase involved in cellulose biosynthesis
MRATNLTLEVADRIEPLAESWDELADRTSAPPFVRPGWIDAWRSSFGRGGLHIVVARRRGRLVGIAPLERRGGALRAPTNEHTPEFDLLAVDDEATRALAERLFADGARTVTLGHLDAGGRSLEALRAAARAAGYRDVVRRLARAPYIRGGLSLADHERLLSRNLRHDTERRLRRLCEAGAVTVQVTDGRDGLKELLDEGFNVERSGWKGAGGTAIASDSRTRRFYAGVARWGASLGWLRVAFLRLDGRAIAFQFDLQTDRTYYSLKIGYDPEYERFSPGKLLAYTMVSRAVVAGLSSYELLGTDEPWKHRWTEDARERVALHAFLRSPAGLLAWSAYVHGRPLARRVPLASRLATALRR